METLLDAHLCSEGECRLISIHEMATASNGCAQHMNYVGNVVSRLDDSTHTEMHCRREAEACRIESKKYITQLPQT